MGHHECPMGVEQLDPVDELRRRERQQALVAELGRSALTGTELPDLYEEALAAAANGLAVDRVELRGPDVLAANEAVVRGGEIAVPIRGQGKPIGALRATSSDPNTFTEDDALFLRAIANLLAVASARDHAEELR